MSDDIAAGLERADPAGASVYRANAARYVTSLRALDRRLARRIAAVPRAERKLVTNHDAFGYFARRYAITVVGAVIPSLSTAAEPSARPIRGPGQDHQARGRQGHLRRVLGRPQARARHRPGGRRHGQGDAVRRHAGAGGQPRGDLRGRDDLRHGPDGQRVHREVRGQCSV